MEFLYRTHSIVHIKNLLFKIIVGGITFISLFKLEDSRENTKQNKKICNKSRLYCLSMYVNSEKEKKKTIFFYF